MFKIKKEERSQIKLALKEIIDAIEKLTTLTINNKTYTIERVIGGDMKFLSILYGINESNSDYPCIWCYWYKKDYRNYDKIWSIKNRDLGARTLQQAKEKCKFKDKAPSKHNGHVDEPLIEIEFCRIIIDLLHLFLR